MILIRSNKKDNYDVMQSDTIKGNTTEQYNSYYTLLYHYKMYYTSPYTLTIGDIAINIFSSRNFRAMLHPLPKDQRLR